MGLEKILWWGWYGYLLEPGAHLLLELGNFSAGKR